jgi:hypothetical protein
MRNHFDALGLGLNPKNDRAASGARPSSLLPLRLSLGRHTADVLKVISSSPGELEPVFDAILKNAIQLAGASWGVSPETSPASNEKDMDIDYIIPLLHRR